MPCHASYCTSLLNVGEVHSFVIGDVEALLCNSQ